MKLNFNFYVFFRLIIGLVLFVSGFEKIVSPYQNFLFVIQSYEMFPLKFAEALAHGLPWVEFITGLFLILGIWIKFSLISSASMFVGFLIVVGQALIRELPIDECGCFGEMITLPPQAVFMFDSCMLVFSVVLFKKIEATSRFSLDQFFLKDA